MRKIIGYTGFACGQIVIITLAQEQDLSTTNMAVVLSWVCFGIAVGNYREIVEFFRGKK